MSYLNNQKANYDKFPHIDVAGFAGQSWQGWDNLFDAVDSKIQTLGSRQNRTGGRLLPGR